MSNFMYCTFKINSINKTEIQVKPNRQDRQYNFSAPDQKETWPPLPVL